MFTFAKALAAGRFHAEDSNTGRTWKNYQVRMALNFALMQLQKIATRINKGWYETVTSFGLIAGTEQYALPSQALRIIKVEYLKSGSTNEPRKLSQVWINERNLVSHRDDQGEPLYFYVAGDNLIGILPVPEDTEAVPTTAGVTVEPGVSRDQAQSDDGPIRVTYVERVRMVEELDLSIGLKTNDATVYDPVAAPTVTPTLRHGLIGQSYIGPIVNGTTAATTNFWPNTGHSIELVGYYVRRDRDSGPLAPPLLRSPPYRMPISIASPLDQFLVIDDWPLIDDWPAGATHFDIWMRQADGAVGGWDDPTVDTWHMTWLTTLPKAENHKPSDGTIGFPNYGDGATSGREDHMAEMLPGPGYLGPPLMWGSQIDLTTGTGDFKLIGAVKQRLLNVFPKSWTDRSYLWPPSFRQGSTTPLAGTAIYTDTNPALHDADHLSDEIHEEHLELVGGLAAIILLNRHGFENNPLMGRVNSLSSEYREDLASRVVGQRKVKQNNPDPSNRARGARSSRNLRG